MRLISAKYKSICHGCKDVVLPGQEVLYDEAAKKVFHPGCKPAEQGDLLGPTEASELADKLGFTNE